jgi:small subunit ribosomal protein S19
LGLRVFVFFKIFRNPSQQSAMRSSSLLLSRSIWKGPFLPFALPLDPLELVRTDARATTIIPAFVGRQFESISIVFSNVYIVHNGQKYISVKISEEMINRKLGEFSRTKKAVVYKKKT